MPVHFYKELIEFDFEIMCFLLNTFVLNKTAENNQTHKIHIETHYEEKLRLSLH